MNDNQNPSSDQPLVTHEDLPVLKAMLQGGFADGWRPVVERLIAAAEADKPALPEGWVLACKVPGDHRTVKWSHGQGLLTNGPDVSPADNVATWRIEEYASVTPLVTAASLIPEGWHVDEDGEGLPTVWDANELVLWPRLRPPSPDPVFDVLAALVAAAEAERGESR